MQLLSSRILWQLWAFLGGVVIVSMIVTGWTILDQFEKDARDTLKAALKNQAITLQQFAIPHIRKNTLVTDKDLRKFTLGIDYKVTLINAEGKVLADNRESAYLMNDHSKRPEILEAQANGFGTSERFNQTTKQNMLYAALMIDQDTKGFIRLAIPIKKINNQLKQLRSQILMNTIIITVIFLIISFFIARKIIRPLVEITNNAEQIALGRYGLRLSSGRNDEIGKLSVAMNKLASETEARIQDLTSSRNQLATVLAGLTEGVIAVDMNCSIMHINDSAQNMLKIDAQYSRANRLHDLPQIMDLAHSSENCLQEGIKVHISIKVDQRNIDALVAPLHGLDNQPIGAIIVLQDITEVLHLEKVRSDFVANASHELKTPISAIRGLVETVIDDSRMARDTLDTFLNRIKNQTIRLDTIVQDLIRLSRFDAQETNNKNDDVNLCELLRQAHKAKLEDAADYNVNLTLDLPPEPIFVKGEREALEQMVSNLLENGIKYSGDNGRVQLQLNKLGQIAKIKVSDDGIGIPLGEQERVFERFYRVDRGRSRQQGGTGLGLSIVKHIVNAHHGEVRIDSELDKGTTFEVRIPAHNSNMSIGIKTT